MLNDIYHLFARHPQMAEDANFMKWLAQNGAAYWYDTGYTDPSPRVVIVSLDETQAWGVLEDTPDFNDDTWSHARILKTSTTDLTQLPARETVIRDALGASKLNRKSLVSARPTLTFTVDGANWDWEVETDTGGSVVSYTLSHGIIGDRKYDRISAVDNSTIPPMADDLASNELHSPYLFAAEAQQWTQGPLTIREKARRIAQNVYQTYSYDSSIPLISEFTWRDTLVRDRNNRRGICDEWAVVQISYLRSIGIAARLKFLIWRDAAGQGVGHACLEFNDGGTWIHMDALWQAFDYASRYRASGAQNVTVMDADYPLDSRSNSPAWGKPDIQGDGLMYPYGDFIINPGYPGNSRAGYSY